MRFKKICVENFRNIESLEIDIDEKDIVFIGTNGQGKTNLLEALYTLSYGNSFRTSHLKDQVGNGKKGFFLKAFYHENYDGEVSVSYFSNERKIEIDKKEVKDRKELIYLFPTICFTHEDINFIEGEPEKRRKFFNQFISLYCPSYFEALRNYKALLKKRNAAIRGEKYSVAELYNSRLAFYGKKIMEEREEAVKYFNSLFSPLYEKITGEEEEVYVSYKPSWSSQKSVKEIEEELYKNIERDKALLSTSTGIQKDQFILFSSKGVFSQKASTGQIRLSSVLFRIAESLCLKDKGGKTPILLLDDVLLEIDTNRRGKVLNEISSYSQAFYTFLPDEKYFSGTKDALVYEVKEGKVEKRG